MLDLAESRALRARVEKEVKELDDMIGTLGGKKNIRRKQQLEEEKAEKLAHPMYKAALAVVGEHDTFQNEKQESERRAAETQAQQKLQAEAVRSLENAAAAEAAVRMDKDAAFISGSFDQVGFQKAWDEINFSSLRATKVPSSAELDFFLRNCPYQVGELMVPKVQAAFADKKQEAAALALLDHTCSMTAAAAAGLTLVSALAPQLLMQTQDAKLGKTAIGVLKKVVTAESKGAILFLPILLEAIDEPPQRKWKIRAAALEVLDCGLGNLHVQAPSQVAHQMATLVEVLVACCKEARSEIKNVAAQLLHQVGKMVKCGEIKAISEKLVLCLVNFGNTQLATETLSVVSKTTFLSQVDAASFALLFPIAQRAMKENNFQGKKNGIMILGAAVLLIEDETILNDATGHNSYLSKLLPLLKEIALCPTFELVREAAKTLGVMANNIEGMKTMIS